MQANAINALAQTVAQWKRDPVRFVRTMWPAVELEPFQIDALQALVDHGKVSIRSGHGVGKSAVAAWSILWFLMCHYPAKVPVSAPTGHQLADVLVAELAMWWRRMPGELSKLFEMTGERFYLRSAREECFASFRTGTKDNPEALQGFHAENLLFVIDEASGIPDIVFEVAEGALSTPGAKVLMASNPTRTKGYFYDSHHTRRAEWYVMRVACHESSRVTQKYIDNARAAYGEHSNRYRVRVLGDFPTEDDDALIALHMIESAIGRDIKPLPYRPIWGLDVGLTNDRSALCKRRANVIEEKVLWWRGKDTMETVGIVFDEYKRALAKDRPDWKFAPNKVLVDEIGIGAGVVHRLKELGVPARGVNFGSKSGDPRFANLRNKLYWEARKWFEDENVSIVEDPDLIAEATAVKFRMGSAGRLEIQRKDKIKEITGVSPDLFEAFVYTFAGGLEPIPERYMQDRYRQTRNNSGSWRTL